MPILFRMVANVETEPLGSAFAYAGDYVKDMGRMFMIMIGLLHYKILNIILIDNG